MNHEQITAGLKGLSELADARRVLDQSITDVVLVLRSPGLDGRCAASWQEIADALGVSRQAAWRMYVEPK